MSNFFKEAQAWTPPVVSGGGGGGLDYDFSDWASGAISATRNMEIVSGVATLNGGVLISPDTYTAGTLIFTATFDGGAFQHAGFAVDMANAPWAIVSSRDGEGGSFPGLWARSWPTGAGASTDTLLSSTNYDTSYTFKIVWGASDVKYYVNNVLKVTHVEAVSGSLNVMVSDFERNTTTLIASAITVDGTSIII